MTHHLGVARAGIRGARYSGHSGEARSRRCLRRCSSPARRCENWRKASSPSPAPRWTPPASSTSSTTTSSASYGWSAAEGLTIERDNPLNPVNLAFDKSGNLLVLSSSGPEGTVYTFSPGSPKDQFTLLAPQPAQPHPGAKVILPANFWNNGEFRNQLDLDTLVYKTLAQMFAGRCDGAEGKGIRIGGRQRVSAGVPRFPARGRRHTSTAGVFPTLWTLTGS